MHVCTALLHSRFQYIAPHSPTYKAKLSSLNVSAIPVQSFPLSQMLLTAWHPVLQCPCNMPVCGRFPCADYPSPSSSALIERVYTRKITVAAGRGVLSLGNTGAALLYFQVTLASSQHATIIRGGRTPVGSEGLKRRAAQGHPSMTWPCASAPFATR